MKIDLINYTKEYAHLDYVGKEQVKESFLTGELSSWTSLDKYISSSDLEKVKALAKEIKAEADILLVIGIGGSFMGSKAIIEALKPYHEKSNPEIIYLGTDLDAKYYEETFAYLKDKDFYLNVISKSGNTLEPSLAFDLAKKLVEDKYGDLAKGRIIITTDKENGSLRALADKQAYKSLVIPSAVGGRFSCFTTVGLLPLAVSGINVDELLNGVEGGMRMLDEALDYSYRRKDLEEAGKLVESFTIYETRLSYLAEWLRQLFGETQGKENKGILPIYNLNTRDLHSMGQFLQEGNKIIFETVISSREDSKLVVEKYNKNLGEINYLTSHAVARSHEKGDTPSIFIELERIDEYNLAKLMQFFIYAAIMGALIDKVNPFDQPGVEAYKVELNKSLENN